MQNAKQTPSAFHGKSKNTGRQLGNKVAPVEQSIRAKESFHVTNHLQDATEENTLKGNPNRKDKSRKTKNIDVCINRVRTRYSNFIKD